MIENRAVIKSVRGHTPVVPDSSYVADQAVLIGDVVLGECTSVWFNVTIRGDVMPIHIGAETNIQDNSVLHGTYQEQSCQIGNRVTIGHGVILHGCKIEDLCLIGMGSTIMDGAVIGKASIVGAGSLVTQGKHFPENSLITGRPAVFRRKLTAEEIQALHDSADHYLMYMNWYKDQNQSEQTGRS